MRINKAAMSFGIVTFSVSITCSVCAKYIPEPFNFMAVGGIALFGAMLSAMTIDLMSELKE